MQLYALDHTNAVVYAGHATRQQDYTCIECRQIVRVRGGLHRQIHYYHQTSDQPCRLNGKSMVHLQVQMHIQKLIPEKIVLEQSFPSINRIADVVWMGRQLVFEIQCSPITAVEVLERNRDYASLGFTVIWILHEQRFNQWRVSAAEAVLKRHPHYFTNIDEHGIGEIYDQFSMMHLGRREHKLKPLPIVIQEPKLVIGHAERHINVECIRERLCSWPLFFPGDLLSLYLEDSESEYIAQAIEREASLPKKQSATVGDWLYYLLVRPYQLFFQILLEKYSR
ncbi:MAG: hypothetical protein H0X51_00820 [Parachlamydiaceae bacterium]|nr:hypothetical protein [Parachlamydiaceae bacterium]